MRGLLVCAALLVGCAPALPGTPDPSNPLVFPANRPDAVVECTGQSLKLTASRLPADAMIEVWVKGSSAGGFKIGNPPRPESYGATLLGSARTDAEGNMAFSFPSDATLTRYENATGQLELWLVYPTEDGKTPILPGAASFKVCPTPGS